MSEIYKIIHPMKYLNDYLTCDIRPDGREFTEHREIKLNVGSIKTAESSALIKCGNTSVVCGIQLELCTPKAEEPNFGFLVTNVELPPLCSSKFRPGPPSDNAQVINNLVSDIIVNSKCVDLTDLCIIPDKLAWVLYCDLICIDNDGSLVDACLIALMASLKTLSLPKVSYDPETEEIKVDPKSRTDLKIHAMPIATSFSVYSLNERNIVLTDPTAYEEEICGGLAANLIICYNNGLLCGTQKFGGNRLLEDNQDAAMAVAKERAKIAENLIDVCIKN